ncbi:MAG TPA: GNAT family N-acetyltransferase [Actinoplanes sp.]
MLIESRTALDPELAALTAGELQENGPDSAVFAPVEDAAYLVAVVDGRAVGCAAWRPGERGVAELLRMFVRPAFRGRGIARQLIVAIEEEALAAGRAVIRLVTGGHLPAAIALFQSSGYHQIPTCGEHAGTPHGLCFEKRLVALVPVRPPRHRP